jgi:hypothetical protein
MDIIFFNLEDFHFFFEYQDQKLNKDAGNSNAGVLDSEFPLH